MAVKKKRRKDNNRIGRRCISIILLVFVIVMSVKIVELYEKDQEYIEIEAEREELLKDEQERKAELEEYEAYTQSQQGKEDIAKSKLGLVHDNEMVFKEK